LSGIVALQSDLKAIAAAAAHVDNNSNANTNAPTNMSLRPEVEDEFDYDEGITSPGGTKVVQNQPHDEEVALSDDDDGDDLEVDDDAAVGGGVGELHDSGGLQERAFVDDDDDDAGLHSPLGEQDSPGAYAHSPLDASPPPGAGRGDFHSHDEDSGDEKGAGMPKNFGGLEAMPTGGGGSPGDGGGAGGGGAGEGGSANGSPKVEGAYDPDEYKDLNVSAEIAELFQYIGRFKPVPHTLETKLRPFIPDYIPSVGDIDEFIKVPRPDGKPDDLGLKVLDEPAAKQSDSTVLNLQMRAASKTAGMQPAKVSGIDRVDRNPKKLDEWVASVEELHKGKPRAAMAYSKPMPDVETLMQEWPPEVENVLNRVRLPEGGIPVRLLSKIACTLTDIPVYNNPVESLHLLFSLYNAFKENPSFANMA